MDDLFEMEVSEVEVKFNSLEDEIKTESARAKNGAAGAVRKKADIDAELLEAKTGGEHRKLEFEIESLQNQLGKQTTQNSRLEDNVREAQSQCRELATKAIEGASGTKTAEKLQELAMELAKSPQKR